MRAGASACALGLPGPGGLSCPGPASPAAPRRWSVRVCMCAVVRVCEHHVHLSSAARSLLCTLLMRSPPWHSLCLCFHIISFLGSRLLGRRETARASTSFESSLPCFQSRARPSSPLRGQKGLACDPMSLCMEMRLCSELWSPMRWSGCNSNQAC